MFQRSAAKDNRLFNRFLICVCISVRALAAVPNSSVMSLCGITVKFLVYEWSFDAKRKNKL